MDNHLTTYQVIAEAMAFYYYTFKSKHLDTLESDKNVMIAAAIMDTLPYLQDESLNIDELKFAYNHAQKGVCRLLAYEYSHEKSNEETSFVSVGEPENTLLNYIMQVECLIFYAEKSVQCDENTIIQSVISEKEVIANTIQLVEDYIKRNGIPAQYEDEAGEFMNHDEFTDYRKHVLSSNLKTQSNLNKNINLKAYHNSSFISSEPVKNNVNENEVIGDNDLTFTRKEGDALQPNDYYEPQKPKPWARYFAKMVDITLISSVMGILLYIVLPFELTFFLRGEGFLNNIIYLFIVVQVEAFILASLGTTPGKWILNVKLSDSDGGRLSYGQAFKRNNEALLKGLGLGIIGISLICMIASYKTLKEMGATPWDKNSNVEVKHRPISGMRIFVTGVYLMIWAVYVSLM